MPDSGGRIPWKESNLALIGSELDHKIKQAAAQGEPQWTGIGLEAGLTIWRIEQFRVVPWPKERYGSFHTGDSYVILNSYKKNPSSDALAHDLHIWIGNESSQDEYGTAAYKMVEADDYLGGVAVQHRQVQGHEGPKFLRYFDGPLKYLTGGVETGFRHVEPTKDTPHLYRVKGTERGMSLTQMPLNKSSINSGDSFILFANPSLVWLWHGSSANPEEKARANLLGEKMCTHGTVTVMDQGSGDDEVTDFWSYLGDGTIADANEDDDAVEEFSPLLFKVMPDDQEPEQIAKGETVKSRFSPPVPRISRSHLNDNDIFILDSGWEVFLWIGNNADRSEKLASMAKADAYCQQDPRTSDVPLAIVKSGFEDPDFLGYFFN